MLLTRRELLARIGLTAGAGVMLNAMTAIGAAKASQYDGPIDLQGDPKGKSVLILGAGLAGMSAALELRRAGYQVKVLEYLQRSGGRCWSLRRGDKFTELGGNEQTCEFDEGLYINPGPWRIPYHHHAVLDYCRRLGVALQTFNQINFNAYLHSPDAFDGKPQRYRHVFADFNGQISELLAKAAADGRLDDLVSNEDRDSLVGSLDSWGALNEDHAYVKGLLIGGRRGYERPYGGGLGAAPTPSTPMEFSELIKSGLIPKMLSGFEHDYQHTLFEPIGGMDMIAKAFDREVGDLIEHGAKVTAIAQDDSGVTVSYERTDSGEMVQASADYCICTLPLPILNQIELQASSELKNAIAEIPYAPSVKTGLQFNRRFWEEDESIFGGISYTDLPITQISYPSTDYLSKGKGVLLGEYTFGPDAVKHTSLTPQDRIKEALKHGRQIHPQYDEEFDNGISVAWHRVPWTMGCYGIWTDERRESYYDTLCKFDGRLVLAGEHASYIPGWQEGAILSSLDATLLFAMTSYMAMASPHGAELEGRGFTAETGEALYSSICLGCHMEGGKGAAEVGHYPALVGNPTIASDVYVMQMVMYGNRGMPGFAGFLSDEQIAEIVNYVRGDLGDNAFAADLSPDTVADARDSARTDPLE